MSDNPDPSDVRITVPRQSSDSDDDSTLRDGPVVQDPEYLIVVPVTEALLDTYTGINVRRLLQTAVALAADNDGRLLLLGIETVPDRATRDTVRAYVDPDQSIEAENQDVIETVEARQTQVTEMTDVAQKLTPNVQINGLVWAVTDVTDAILAFIEDGEETAVLLPRGAGLDDSRLLTRSTIDTILANAECDVFVENMDTHGGENALYVPDVDEHTVASLAESEGESIDSVLLPVESGPHSALAAEAARAVARAADASVTVLHVISTDAGEEATADGRDLLKFADYVLGSDVSTETELKEASETTDAIIQEAKVHDFISIGAPEEKSRLEQLVFESVQQTLSEESEATVLMSRDSDKTMRSLYYRWKRGIEQIEDDESESET